MHVIKRKKTSRCTGSKIVYEYLLSDPIDTEFISILKNHGVMDSRQLGKLVFFSFHEGEWLSMKGMSGDNIVHVTHMKSDNKRAEEFINRVVQMHEKCTES